MRCARERVAGSGPRLLTRIALDARRQKRSSAGSSPPGRSGIGRRHELLAWKMTGSALSLSFGDQSGHYVTLRIIWPNFLLDIWHSSREALAEIFGLLNRTVITSPVNGYITNLHLRLGDYALTGQTQLSIVDSDSFWVAGYFEETKLPYIRFMSIGWQPISFGKISGRRGDRESKPAPGGSVRFPGACLVCV